MPRKTVNVAVIIPDASPVLTLARIGRLDLLDTFSAPIQIVDQVHYEITKPANDPAGRVAAWLNTAAWIMCLADFWRTLTRSANRRWCHSNGRGEPGAFNRDG